MIKMMTIIIIIKYMNYYTITLFMVEFYYFLVISFLCLQW